MIKNLFPFQVNQFEVKQLTKYSHPEIETFLNLFDDFFQLCEGEKGSALGLLEACPPTKNIHQDKFVLGFFDRNNLVGLIDLIANYPEKNTWTIGYFFIHPSYQHQGLGAQFFHALEGILAEVDLPLHLPFGLHGNFYKDPQLFKEVSSHEKLIV